MGGPIRGPAAVDKKTQISISKRLQVMIYMWDMYMNSVLQLDYNFRKTKQAMTLIFAIQLHDI